MSTQSSRQWSNIYKKIHVAMGYNFLRKQWKWNNNIIYIGLITQFCLLCNTSNKCADNSNKRVISRINHTLYIYHKHDIDNRYRTDIHKPTSSRYITPISTQYRLFDINTISPVDWPSSSRYTFTHRTNIGSTLQKWYSTDIEIRWNDICPLSAWYRMRDGYLIEKYSYYIPLRMTLYILTPVIVYSAPRSTLHHCTV